MHLLCCMFVSLKQHCVYLATDLSFNMLTPFLLYQKKRFVLYLATLFFVDLGKVLPDTVQIVSSGTGEKYGSSSLWPMILDELHAYVFCGNICFSDLYFSA